MQTKSAIGAQAMSSNYAEHRGPTLLAANFYKTASRKIQGGKNGCAVLTDILGYRFLTLRKTSVLREHFDQYFSRNIVARFPGLVCPVFGEGLGGFFLHRPKTGFDAGLGDFVAPRGIEFKTSRRMLADKSHGA